MISRTFKLNNPLVGFSVAHARPPEMAQILRRGLFTSDDGPSVYTFLDGFGDILTTNVGVRPEAVESCLFNVIDGTLATVWINPGTVLDAIAKKGVRAGQPTFLDDLADVRGIRFPECEMPSRGAVVYVFKQGWRTGFYFNFPPGEEPNRPIENLSAQLGSAYAALMFRGRIRMDPEILEKMYTAGWFPFIRLTNSLARELYSHFEAGWEPDEIEARIVSLVKASVADLRAGWKNKKEFQPHMEVLSDALGRFESGDYLAASALLMPKVEGLLRTMNLGQGKLGQRDLRTSLIKRVRVNVTGVTALMPEPFADYLGAYYYASFDLDKGEVPPSRNAFLHGVGPDGEMKKASFCAKLLLTIDQISFYL